jgi:L-amino acid N-acyltransferase YncA
MPYIISEVDGTAHQDVLTAFNKLVPEWPLLESRHFSDGYWWFVSLDGVQIGFAGLVPFSPVDNYGYLKRCYIGPDHHGHGLQYRLMVARELKAKQLGWTHLVSECHATNLWSANNFRKAGFSLVEPEQVWGQTGSLYWIKKLPTRAA